MSTMTLGSSGADVASLQRMLTRAGVAWLVPDGIYGVRTRAAVMQYQVNAGLPRTGDADAATVDALTNSTTAPASGTATASAATGDATTADVTALPPLGQRALVVALAELAAGVREDPMGSNRGTRVDEYTYPTGLRGVAWCETFESWCRRRALVAGEANPLGYNAAVASLWRAAIVGPVGYARPPQWAPAVGDVAIFRRANQDPRTGGEGHVARVETTPDGYGAFTAIAGNSANAVSRETHSVHDPDLVGWISQP